MTPAAVLVVWSIGLAGALFLTIVVLRVSRLLIGTLTDLLALTRTIADAAHGINKHVSVIPTLSDLESTARQPGGLS